MEEKERYELIGYCSYRDTETGVIGDNFVGVLNEQDKKIKDLEAKLEEYQNDGVGDVIINAGKKIKELQQQLAEKEKKIESCNHTIYMNILNQEMLQLKVANLEQSQKQLVISELEKVAEFLLEKIEEKQSDFDSGNYNDFADGVKTICELMLISIDKQIKSLKGEK